MEISPTKPSNLVEAAGNTKGRNDANLASFGNVAMTFTTMVQKAGNKMLRQGSSPEIERAAGDAGGSGAGREEPEIETPETQAAHTDDQDRRDPESPQAREQAPVAERPAEMVDKAPLPDVAEAPQQTNAATPDDTQQAANDDAAGQTEGDGKGDDALAQGQNGAAGIHAETPVQTGAEVMASLAPILKTAQVAVNTGQAGGDTSRVVPVETVIQQLQQAKNPATAPGAGASGKPKVSGDANANAQNQNALTSGGDDNEAFLNDLLGKKTAKTAGTKASQQGQQASAAKADNANAQAQVSGQARTEPLNPAQTQAQQLAKTLNNPKANLQVNVNVTDEAQTLISKPAQALTPTAVATKAGTKADGGQPSAQANQNANPANVPQPGIAGQPAQSAQSLAQLAAGANAQAVANGQAGTAATTTAGSGAEGVNPTASVSPAAGAQPGQMSQAALLHKPAAPQQPASPRAVMEQVTVQITKAMNAGADKINIQLRPASLGRVEVQLEMNNGRITATVIADSKDTLELLKDGAKDLAKALNSAGLQTDSQDLNFSLREQGNQNTAHKGDGKDGRLDFDEAANGEGGSDNVALEAALRDIISEGHIDVRA